jgi:hypothetical protein
VFGGRLRRADLVHAFGGPPSNKLSRRFAPRFNRRKLHWAGQLCQQQILSGFGGGAMRTMERALLDHGYAQQ